MDKNKDRMVQDIGIIALAAATAILIFGGMDAAKSASERSQPSMGDIIVVKAGSKEGVRYRVEARLPDGKSCTIGIGPLADGGGSIEVVGLGEPDSRGVTLSTVAWNGPGRSAAEGPDCGHHVDVTIPRHELAFLRSAASGMDPAYNSSQQAMVMGGY